MVLYGCETLTLREKHGLKVFKKMVLRSIFVPKSDVVTGKLHNEEFVTCTLLQI
jgi:hypothetical protein